MPAKALDLSQDLSALALADRSMLLEEWGELYGSPVPKNISTLMLRRAVAHRLQEKAHGGLKPAMSQYLRQIAQAERKMAPTVRAPEPALTPGSRLIREWNGKTYEVTVLVDGRCEMNGDSYRSLTHVAQTITGAKWSGPRFFGLVKVTSK